MAIRYTFYAVLCNYMLIAHKASSKQLRGRDVFITCSFNKNTDGANYY